MDKHTTEQLKIKENTTIYQNNSYVKHSIIWAIVTVIVTFIGFYYFDHMTSTLADKDIQITKVTHIK